MLEKQDHIQDTAYDDLQEIWFLIEKDEDGYPESRSWEGLWARPTDRGFELLSVPFYLKNVSKGDVVSASRGDFLRFVGVQSRGGHNTYRLLMENASAGDVKTALAELRSKGLMAELNESGMLISIDVPPSVDQQELDRYLLSDKKAGRWQIQDGFHSSPPKA